MMRTLAVLFACLLAGGCESPGEADTAAADREALESASLSGRAAYEMVCASCHESGKDGAPRTGDTEAWSERSPHWEAVLAEHARDGYLAMPAKGGAPELRDAVISRATEYMLLQAYPERPSDQ